MAWFCSRVTAPVVRSSGTARIRHRSMFASFGTTRYGAFALSAVRMRAGAILTESYTAGQRGSARSAA
jgi:hypothetical protein